jgi:hypothetical protein
MFLRLGLIDRLFQEMRPRDIQTIKELFDKNFTIHGYGVTVSLMKGTEFENRSVTHNKNQHRKLL